MSRRSLSLGLVAGLLVGLAPFGLSTAQAADPAPQTLDLGTVPLTRATGTDYTPVPVGTVTSPLTIVLDPGNTVGACSKTGQTISFLAAGTCTVDVTAPADSTHEASNTVRLVFAVKAPQTLDLGTVPLARTTGTGYTPTPVGTVTSPLTVVLDAGNTGGVCTKTGTTVDFLAAGTCTVHVTAPEDSTRLASNTVDLVFTVKEPQTLDLGTVALARNTGSSWTPAPVGTVTSPLDVVLDAGNTGGVCTQTGTTVDFLAAGTCTVHVTAPADSTHDASNTVDLVFTVKGAQTLDLGTVALSRKTGTSYTPAAVGTTTSPLTVVLDAGNTTGVCSLASGTVSFLATGTCTVHVTAPADSTHHASNTVDLVFAVKAPQTLDLGTVALTRQTGTSYTPAAVGTTTSPLTVVLDSGNTTGVCSLASGTVSFLASGTCTVHVTAPEDGTRAESNTVDLVFAVKAPQTLDLGTVALTRQTGTTYTPAPVGTVTTPLTVTLDSGNTPGVCTKASGIVTFAAAGTCTVHVTAPEDATHLASNTVDLVFLVKDPQTPTASVTGSTHYAGARLTPTVANAYGAVTLVSLTTDTCTVDGAAVVLVEATDCDVEIRAAGDTTHLPGTGLLELTVTPRPVTVTVTTTTLPPFIFGDTVLVQAVATATQPTSATSLGGTGTVTVTAPDAGGVIASSSYNYGGSTPATLSFSAGDVGDYVVSATFTPLTGDVGVYASSSGTANVDVDQASQVITIADPPPADTVYVGQTWTSPATNSVPANVPVITVSTSSTEPACEAVGTTGVKFLRSGSCTINADHVATRHHTAGHDDVTVTPALRPVDLSFVTTTADPADEVLRYLGPATVTVTARDRISGAVVPVNGTGTVQVVGDDATAQAVTFTNGVATYSYTPTVVGTHAVKVAFTPDPVGGIATYATVAAATASPGSLSVAQAQQAIRWGTSDTVPTSDEVDETWVTGATGGASGKPVVLTSLTPLTCAVDGLSVDFLAATVATCQVRADQAGTTNYAAATRTAEIRVDPRPVDVTVSWPAGARVYLDPVLITVRARDHATQALIPDVGSDDSGTGVLTVGPHTYPVTFEGGVATVLFTPTDVRTYAVSSTFVPTRQQAYTTTTPTAVDLVVTKAPQTIVLGRAAPTSPNKNDTWQPKATGGLSGNAVTVTASPSSVCSVGNPPSGNTDGPVVEFKKFGDCTVTFKQATSTYYLAATDLVVEVGVKKVGVALAVTVPTTSRTFEQQVVVAAAATSLRDVGTAVPGTVAITVTDVTTPASPVSQSTTADGVVVEVDPVDGTAEITFPGKMLLAGSYRVDATFTPTATDDYEQVSEHATFTVTLASQTLTRTDALATPTAARVTGSWTPTYAQGESGLDVTLQVRAASSIPTAQPEYADLTLPSATCSVTDDTKLRFDAQGTCVVDAVLAPVARQYQGRSVLAATVAVTRIPIDLTLGITSPGAPATGPAVDHEVQVRVSAKVDGRALVGYGPLTVKDGSGAALADLPGATADWFGGGRFYSFIPTTRGDYRVDTTFLLRSRSDRLTYQSDSRTDFVEIDRAAQTIQLTELPPTEKLVRQRWTPQATGGASGQPIVLGIDPIATSRTSTAPGAPLICEVDDGEILFQGKGECVVTLDQAGTTDGYDAAPTYTTPPITVSQTVIDVAISAPANPQVGVPVTITATATAGGLPVAGSGPLTISSGTTEVRTVTGAWTDGVQTLSFTPTRAGADMSITADFKPDDLAAYAIRSAATTRTFATGVQSVALTADHGASAWVGQTWTPGPVGTGSGNPPSLEVVATPSGACTLVDGVVAFARAGSCQVTASLAAVDGSFGLQNWAAAAPVVRTVAVSAHPTEVTLEEPAEEKWLVERDLTVEAQVAGYRSGGSASEYVDGKVQFTVDGEAYGAPVPVDPSGLATGVVRVVLEPGEELVVDHEVGAVFTPTDAVFWAVSDASRDLVVERNAQTIDGDTAGPGDLFVGRSWTPEVTASSGLPVTVTVAEESADVCSAVDGTVTIDASAVGADECTVVIDQAGDTEFAPLSVRPQITAKLNPTAVVLTLPTAVVGAAGQLHAAVSAPGALDPAPAGTVTFLVDGVAVASDVAVSGGIATASFTPGTALARVVTATFTPAVPTTYAVASSTRALSVAPVPTTTSVRPITEAGIEARVVSSVAADTALTGTVRFGYATLAAPDSLILLGDPVTLGPDGSAVLTGAMPPATQEVTVWAVYQGDRDHASSSGTRRRGLPTITPTVDGDLTGWNRKPVSITFACARDTAALATDCPSKAVRSADGADQAVSVSVTAVDGGRRTLTISGIDIDRTGPVVDISGTSPGAWYTGTAPPSSCSGARDTLSGLASCTVRRTVGAGRKRTDTATAVDKAGNTTVESVSYDVWDYWVDKAPLRGTDFQVKPSSTPKLVVLTYGPKPQLMLPDGKGVLRPRAVFRASRIDNGLITWTVAVTLPKKAKAGSSYRFGYRLDGGAKITAVGLDLVKKPAGQRPS